MHLTIYSLIRKKEEVHITHKYLIYTELHTHTQHHHPPKSKYMYVCKSLVVHLSAYLSVCKQFCL